MVEAAMGAASEAGRRSGGHRLRLVAALRPTYIQAHREGEYVGQESFMSAREILDLTRAAGVDMLASQAPVDGVHSYLPAGPVTEADVLRLYPWPDATMVGELGEEEVSAVGRSVWPNPQAAWGFDATDRLGGGTATLAVLEGDAAVHVERILGRRVEWRRTGVKLREAVGRALS